MTNVTVEVALNWLNKDNHSHLENMKAKESIKTNKLKKGDGYAGKIKDW
ncbi:hypothetical protein GWK17_09020 [Bacillus selenatarsenatis]|uniref:Uncharacterized protein n=1 Tax=Mesobacillus selenatarsenatis TaxID=388741 RepID=A0A846TN77_9BACI|nr:hypothetical protein [Mesobacillus selenatarsenatis]